MKCTGESKVPRNHWTCWQCTCELRTTFQIRGTCLSTTLAIVNIEVTSLWYLLLIAEFSQITPFVCESSFEWWRISDTFSSTNQPVLICRARAEQGQSNELTREQEEEVRQLFLFECMASFTTVSFCNPSDCRVAKSALTHPCRWLDKDSWREWHCREEASRKIWRRCYGEQLIRVTFRWPGSVWHKWKRHRDGVWYEHRERPWYQW